MQIIVMYALLTLPDCHVDNLLERIRARHFSASQVESTRHVQLVSHMIHYANLNDPS